MRCVNFLVLSHLLLGLLTSEHDAGLPLRLMFQVLREPADLPALADALARRLSDAEQCQVNKLDALYSIVNTAARETAHADQERIIRERVRAYFDADADAELQPPPELVRLGFLLPRVCVLLW
jgi:hypothetical protein